MRRLTAHKLTFPSLAVAFNDALKELERVKQRYLLIQITEGQRWERPEEFGTTQLPSERVIDALSSPDIKVL